jgi:Hom_end-associated Hint/SNF2-related domain/LAGLIDADG-like domain
MSLTLSKQVITKLSRINGCHPLTLVAEVETRRLLQEFLDAGIYTIQPEALAAIKDALAQVESIASPIMPLSDFELVAYGDELDQFVCNRSVNCDIGNGVTVALTAGKSYPLSTGSYKFTETFTRDKVHFNEESQETYTAKHDCQLTGSDRYIQIHDDNGRLFRFMDRPRKEYTYELPETRLWDWFSKPKVNTVAEVHRENVNTNHAVLKACEMLAGYTYYEGQLNYLSRVAVKDAALIAGETGCHAKGTKIMMWDGTTKNVEDIAVGDFVLHWKDGGYRVNVLARGREEMYRIIPTKGEPFVVNVNHILTLVRTNGGSQRPESEAGGQIVDVTVKEWLGWSKAKKHQYKLFRVGVNWWPEVRQPITPYFFGLMLGDGGLTNQLNFTKPDAEVVKYVRQHANKHGWSTRVTGDAGNPTFHFSNCQSLVNSFEHLGLRGCTSGDKFIPQIYKMASRQQRLDVLAGLIDTDGSLTCGGYDYISKSEQLANDVAFLARSLGLAAYVKSCEKGCQNGFVGTYYRVSISGDCCMVPVKIKRKQAAPRKQKKDALRTGFKVEYVGVDDFYGFNIGGDGRFLMGDFTVTHNTGKTLLAISMLAMKSPHRALIIAPQGTMRASKVEDDDMDEDEIESMSVSQWVKELSKFAPYLQIFEIFSYDDYQRLCAMNNGQLPAGVYLTYYEAFFSNGAKEKAPATWDDDKLNKYAVANKLRALPPAQDTLGASDKHYWCDSIGKEVDGVRCVLEPCLATRIGHLFDCVMADEAHRCKGMDAIVTQMLIRLQPKLRYALTATPVANVVTDMFPIMGWLAVPEWYRGNRRNAAWPYAREDVGRFNSTFLTQERDLTQEDENRRKDPKWRGKCIKDSPIISSPARLLKLVKPNLAFISKEECNANYIKPNIIDVRVHMGREQAVLYGHFTNRANIPHSNPLRRAQMQTAYLRNICADPAGFTHGGPKVRSNMNPKVIAILELVRDILARGEQVTIINSRVGLTDTIVNKLAECGVPIARIDSTLTAEQHAYQANLFKLGRARVMAMGIKCAAAYSFDGCENEIIGSLEYSYGPFNQACGRIDRVTNKVKKNIYCILHKHSIEEVQFEVVSLKGDAANLCLRGKRIPRDFKPVDGSEILAKALDRFDLSGAEPESVSESKWPKLRQAIITATLK